MSCFEADQSSRNPLYLIKRSIRLRNISGVTRISQGEVGSGGCC
jgi:hypothetical protein